MIRKAATPDSRLLGSWRPGSADAEARTVELVWTTGQDVRRVDPFTGGQFIERLSVSERSVDLSRLRAGAPLLDSHEQHGVRNQLGVVEHAWIEGGRGVARVRFSARAEDVFQDVADGVIRNVSVGYVRTEDRELDEQQDGVPVREVTRWVPHEISFVTVPADGGAQVRGKETTMENQEAPAEVAPVVALNDRASGIRSSCQIAGLSEDYAQSLIDQDIPLYEARAKIIDKMATPEHEQVNSRFAPGDGRRERDFANVAAAALLHRERVEDTTIPEALSLSGRSVLELARMAATMDGVGLSTTASAQQIATRALISSTTLTDVIAHTASRSLTLGYQAEPRPFTEIFRESSAKNFRNIERVKISDAPKLPVVAEGAAYTEGALSDAKETYVLLSYGEILNFTRQLVINDDVEAITRAPQMLGAAAAATENDTVWTDVLDANGNLSDGDAIFDTPTHGNLVASTALTAAAVEAARAHFRAQVTENGVAVGLTPAWLVCGGDLETTAEKLLRPGIDFQTSTASETLASSLRNSIQLRIEPRVATGRWYLFSDHRRLDTCEYSYLLGQRGPFIEREVDFSTGSIKLKVTNDFGFGAIDRRGLYRVDA